MLWNTGLEPAPLAMLYLQVLSHFWHGMLEFLNSTLDYILTYNRIGEKFLEWVDDPLPAEAILESVSLYWFTETFPRGIFFYREVRPYSLYD